MVITHLADDSLSTSLSEEEKMVDLNHHNPPYDDPDVACADNPFPKRCQSQHEIREAQLARDYTTPYFFFNQSQQHPLQPIRLQNSKHQLNATRLHCTDFYYEDTDDDPVSWRDLQRRITFNPEAAFVYLTSDVHDSDPEIANFYISKDSKSQRVYLLLTPHWYLPKTCSLNQTTRQSIPPRHDWPPHNQPPGIARLIFMHDRREKIEPTYAVNLIYSLLYCLNYYGHARDVQTNIPPIPILIIDKNTYPKHDLV